MIKIIIFISIIFVNNILSKQMQEGEFVKQKQEIIKLKQDLDEFYLVKEKEYKNNKIELTKLQKSIQDKLDNIDKIKEENQKILDEIKLKVQNKAITLYSKMKLKVLLGILNEKIKDGHINEVFDIIIRLKNKRVMDLLKKFDTKVSTELMDKINNYKKESSDGR